MEMCIQLLGKSYCENIWSGAWNSNNVSKYELTEDLWAQHSVSALLCSRKSGPLSRPEASFWILILLCDLVQASELLWDPVLLSKKSGHHSTYVEEFFWGLSGSAWQGCPNVADFVIETIMDSLLPHEWHIESWYSANRCKGGCRTFKRQGLQINVTVYIKCEWSLNPISVSVFSEGVSRTHRSWNVWHFWSQKVTHPVAGWTFQGLISC